MKRNINHIEEVSNALIGNTNGEILKILEILDLEFEDLYCILERITDREKDKVLDMTINKLLKELKAIFTREKYQEITKDVDKITSYYISRQKEDFDIVVEEGNHIADDLLSKVINQELNLPINLSNIKKNYLLTKIKNKEQVYYVLLWIIIRYISIKQLISFKEWKKEYEAGKE